MAEREEPQASQYGLTAEALTRCKQLEHMPEKIGCAFFVAVWLFFVFASIIATKSLLSGFLGAFVGLVVGFWATAAVSAAGLFEFFLRRDAQYQKYEQFQRAVHEYNMWRRRRALWLEHQRREYWLGLSGRQFELELGKLLEELGYNVRVTPHSRDRGLDLIVSKGDEKIGVQCKQHRTKAGPAVARELLGAMVDSKLKAGILVSTSGFTQGVYGFVEGKNIELWDLDNILYFQRQLQEPKLKLPESR